MNKEAWSERLERYDEIVAKAGLERKGKTVPSTTANGYMFSSLNKDGEIGIRLPKEAAKRFMEKHGATIFKSYGAVMRDYVRIPDTLLSNTRLLVKTLKEAHAHVMSLPPK